MVELMVTVLIASILMAVAVPSLGAFINNSRLRASQGELLAALMLARSEATKRGKPVGVVATQTAANFSGGWQVVIDSDDSGTLDPATDLVVRKYPAVAGNQTVLAKYRNTTTPVTELVFNARGFLQKSAIVFTVCGQAAYAKGFQIEIEPVGLADVKEVPNLCS